MEIQGNHRGSDQEELQGYVDWRNRPAYKGRHGGLRAALFVFGSEVFENLAFIAVASNLVTYCSRFIHFSNAEAANTVTNFMGTSFILALLGGFVSDGFLITFRTVVIFAIIELLGMILLTIQAHYPSFRPPACDNKALIRGECKGPNGSQSAILYIGLYLVALGVGGLKGSLAVHGAEQFDEKDPVERRLRSNFFNWFLFSLCTGSLVGVTFVVWVQDNKGWEWGFGISTISIFLLIAVFVSGMTLYRNKLPQGSPLTRIAQVFVAAALKKRSLTTQGQVNALYQAYDKQGSASSNANQIPTRTTPQFRFLDKAAIPDPRYTGEESPWRLCPTTQVEEVKIILRVLPIFASTIIMNCCLAQLQTFSVKQASTMNRTIGNLTVPPASLLAIPVISMLVLIPFYDQVFVPMVRKVTKRDTGITHLQRVGFGLFLSVIAMAVAALVETKRKSTARQHNLIDSIEPLPITVLWVGIQFLMLGVADMFVLAGLMEFFYTEAPHRMKSMSTALSWASTSMGYFLSSVLVDIVNSLSKKVTGTGWISGSNINRNHVERFYWILCVLGALNFVHYLLWSFWYRYSNPGPPRDDSPRPSHDSLGFA